jgi:ketosteroid isomerase-like protein
MLTSVCQRRLLCRIHPNDEHETAKSTAAGNNPVIGNLDHIRSYYDALNSGDAELVASHFTDDAIHYYTRLEPHEGAERIGQNAAMGVGMIDGQWFIEHGIESDDEAVIEWTMTWRDPRSGAERLDRGTEWFKFRDGKIAEIRAYHHGGRKNPQGDLLGFDHEGRGYTMLEGWQPPSEDAKRRAAETVAEPPPESVAAEGETG